MTTESEWMTSHEEYDMKMTHFPLLSNSNYSIELFNMGMITIECKREGRYININNNGFALLVMQN